MCVCWRRLSFGGCQGLLSKKWTQLRPPKSEIQWETEKIFTTRLPQAERSSRVYIGLMLVQCFDSFWPSSVLAAAMREWGMTAHTVKTQTSHCAKARQGWRSCSGAWWVTGNRVATPTLALSSPPRPSFRLHFHPPKWWISLSPQRFHNKSVTVRIMQTDSYSLAECAIRED